MTDDQPDEITASFGLRDKLFVLRGSWPTEYHDWPFARQILTDTNEEWIAALSSDGTVTLSPDYQEKSPQEVATAILHGLSGR